MTCTSGGHGSPPEEKAMLEGLGDAYAEYMARSKRLVPFVF